MISLIYDDTNSEEREEEDKTLEGYIKTPMYRQPREREFVQRRRLRKLIYED